MTLDIPQFIANSVRVQSKVHHLDINVKAVKADEVPKSVKTLITDDYGEKYLEDADCVAFFWGPVNKDNIDKLFNVVDKALGKSANKLTDKDFKKINLDGSKTSDDEETEENVESEVSIEEPDDNDDEEDVEIDVEDDEGSEENDDDEDEENDEEQLNEDDNEEEGIEVAVEEKPEIPTSYFFLKITTK